jgi:transketolase
VTVVAVGGGVAYGNLGYSHHAVQDYALLRAMPNMMIAAPGDPLEVRACMRYLVNNPQPSYLRLGKAGEPCIHAAIPEVLPGKWLNVRNGDAKGSAFLTTGAAMELVNQALNNNIALKDHAHFSMPLWSMKSKIAQAEQVEQFTTISTVEDHLQDGGFGSWLLESVSQHPELLSRIRIKSLDSKVCGMVGKQPTLNAAAGLTEKALCE